MDLRQLEMLLAIVDCGGYTEAGKALYVSHSAIHRQIRLLEHELQVRILVRAGKRVRITETGSLLVDLARRIRQEVSSLRVRIGEAKQLQIGNLRIGTGTNILTFFLPPVLARFRKKFPGVEVQLMTGSGELILREVDSGMLDVAVAYSAEDRPPHERAPKYETLYKEEFVLAVGKGHPLATRRVVSLSDVIKFPFIAFPKPSHVRRLFDRVLASEGMTPKVIMELENEEVMEKMITINLGIALLSKRRAVSDRIHHLRLRGQRIMSEVGLVFPRTDYLPRPVAEFAQMCRDAIKDSNEAQSSRSRT